MSTLHPAPTYDPTGIPRCSRACEASWHNAAKRSIQTCAINNQEIRFNSICLHAIREKLAAGDALAKAADKARHELSWMLGNFPERQGGEYEAALNGLTQALAAWNQTPKGLT